eukprot:ANDGO_04155.mRNA.1 putative pre-mRNA-splicing factor ATP-dependent RNA helicase mog-1
MSGVVKGFLEPVKDPTSDICQIARRGSATLREFRNERDRIKAVREKLSAVATFLGRESEIDGGGLDSEDAASLDASNASTAFSFSLSGSGDDASSSTSASTDAAAELRKYRKYLPIFACRDEFLRVLSENSVLVLVGETGSGKTTQIAQYLYEAGYASSGRICITQPRRVAAVSVARRVADEMGTRLGDLVGYSIRFEDVCSSKTKLRFMTDGILLRESVQDPLLEKYSCVVLDEAHERSLNTDVLFGLLRAVLSKRFDLKVIVTSATLDAHRFASFFGECPVFRIPGRTYPVSLHYSKSPVEDYVDAAVNQVLAIHVSRPKDGDILVFMTGQEDVEITCYLIMERAAKLSAANSQKLVVFPIYSMLPAELQSRIFSKTKHEVERKVIVATNIAETSLTVPGVKYVIDCGFAKFKIYNPHVGMDALQVYPISQAQAQQRAGRAGRTSAGECFRLYTKHQFDQEMLVNQVPELQRSNLANVVLLLRGLGIRDISKFDFLDAPPAESISESDTLLKLIGAVNSTGDLTSSGKLMSLIPLDPCLSCMLLHAVEQACAKEMITIISMISVPKVYVRPPERVAEADSKREKFSVPDSDHLTLLNVYNQWEAHRRSPVFSSSNFLNDKALRRAADIRSQLEELVKSVCNVSLISSCGMEWDILRKCVCAGYFHHAARMKGVGEYVNIVSGLPCVLHPTSALYGAGVAPEYVVYHELILTNKEYMQVATAVEPAWLARFGPSWYAYRNGVLQLVRLDGNSSQDASRKRMFVSSSGGDESASISVTTARSSAKRPKFGVFGFNSHFSST